MYVWLQNYLFALLTGYMDAPAGFQVDEGLHFNPYFRGGALAMPPPLYNEVRCCNATTVVKTP